MSRLYEVSHEGELLVIDDVETKGAAYVIHFYTDNHYLVVANSVDNNQVKLKLYEDA